MKKVEYCKRHKGDGECGVSVVYLLAKYILSEPTGKGKVVQS